MTTKLTTNNGKGKSIAKNKKSGKITSSFLYSLIRLNSLFDSKLVEEYTSVCGPIKLLIMSAKTPSLTKKELKNIIKKQIKKNDEKSKDDLIVTFSIS